MIEIGRLCVKTAGRDAGLKCVIIDILDDRFVLIDGETRRRKCNILHLEPLKDSVKIKKNASHEEIKEEFEKLGLNARETKPKQKAEKQQKVKAPEQDKSQKIGNKKSRDAPKTKKKEEPKDKAAESLDDKAGLSEDKKADTKKKSAKKSPKAKKQ
jgi:large subunit ribosomal protein L14e